MIALSSIFHILQHFNSVGGIGLKGDKISCDRLEYHMRESINLTSNNVTYRLDGKTTTVNSEKDESCRGTSPPIYYIIHAQHRNDKSKLLADQLCHAINGHPLGPNNCAAMRRSCIRHQVLIESLRKFAIVATIAMIGRTADLHCGTHEKSV